MFLLGFCSFRDLTVRDSSHRRGSPGRGNLSLISGIPSRSSCSKGVFLAETARSGGPVWGNINVAQGGLRGSQRWVFPEKRRKDSYSQYDKPLGYSPCLEHIMVINLTVIPLRSPGIRDSSDRCIRAGTPVWDILAKRCKTGERGCRKGVNSLF